ncbi:MAG: hypothetical protein Kow00109_03510 [Acidobacteriota bacterium]
MKVRVYAGGSVEFLREGMMHEAKQFRSTAVAPGEAWMFRELQRRDDLTLRTASGAAVDFLLIPEMGLPGASYQAAFAVSRKAVEAALHLRYRVFNLELGEGLASAHETQLDEDEFDRVMTHVVILDGGRREVVGTYRLQTLEQAARHPVGSYCARQYDLEPLRPVWGVSTECGRACLAKEHRSPRALLALWLGIGAFLNLHRQRYLFGCCSIPSRDPAVGWAAWDMLRKSAAVHPELCLRARRQFSCGPPPQRLPEVTLPKLFRVYLRLGAKVVSEPSFDAEFGTVDFLVLLDARQVALSSLRVVK